MGSNANSRASSILEEEAELAEAELEEAELAQWAIAAAMATARLRSRQRRRMISRRLIMITIPLSISSTTGPDCNSFRRFFFFYSSAAFSVHVLATWHIVSLPIP